MSKYLVKYSVVLDGQGNPFGSAADHEASVEQLLDKLMKSATGHAVFIKIVSHGVVRIEPYDASKYPQYGTCNALAWSGKHQEKVSSGLHRSAVNVSFSVSTWSAMSSCVSGPGSLGDEVLLHELVHAMRKLGDDAASVPLTGHLKNYDNEEEFFAVLVTNIFTSEMGRQPKVWLVGQGNSGLRADHHGNSHLSDEQALAVEFLMDDDRFRLVKKFCDQHPKIAPLIAKVECRFNPLKVYYRWKGMKIEPQKGALVKSK